MALNNVPLAGQTLGQTRDQINDNFSTIATAFVQDHVDYNVSGQGKHNKITFPLQSSVPTFLMNEIGLFDQNAAFTPVNPGLGAPTVSIPDIWMARGTANPFPITGFNYTSNVTGSTFWTFLPSGLKIIGGQNSTGAGQTASIVYGNTGSGGANNFPGFSNPFVGTVNVTRVNNSSTTTSFMVVTTYSYTGFSVRTSDPGTTNATFLWFAIGI
jgi:hypothetical protein